MTQSNAILAQALCQNHLLLEPEIRHLINARNQPLVMTSDDSFLERSGSPAQNNAAGFDARGVLTSGPWQQVLGFVFELFLFATVTAAHATSIPNAVRIPSAREAERGAGMGGPVQAVSTDTFACRRTQRFQCICDLAA